MVDTSHIDITAVIGRDVSLKKQGNNFVGPCPFCREGKDRFVVTPSKSMFWCRRCDKSGDVVTYVMEIDNVGFKNACETLGINIDSHPLKNRHKNVSPRTQINPKRISGENPSQYQVREWQSSAYEFATNCNENLMSGGMGFTYLRMRGFTYRTMYAYGLGYNVHEYKSKWGDTDVYVPAQSIIIPHYDIDLNIFRIRYRDTQTNDSGRKYGQLKGGFNSLYLEHLIRFGKLVVLVEGEFDALSINQVGNRIGVVSCATGGTTGGRLLRWVTKLALAGRVMVAFDSDEPGNDAAKWWLQALPESTRLIPRAHDPNDMLVQGMSIMDWIGVGV